MIGTTLVLGAIALWLFALGGAGDVASWAAGYQRDFQNQIALALRGVRAGNAEALWLLLGACFAYGFFHAAGPGHGKVLIGGYGLGRKVAVARLSVIAVLSSLGQAVSAIALVHGGLWLIGMSRETVTGVAEDALAPVSYGAIVLIGVWLLARGARHLFQRPAPADHAPHAGGHCDTCGHRHGPTLEEAQAVRSPWEAVMLIAGIAIRPCTGALFVLIITWQMGISEAGIAGTFAMALGTALVTVLVAVGAVGLRGGVLGALAGSDMATRVVPVIEIAAGLLVVVGAGALLLAAL
ncbi:nickel/cobalt transporter [Sulfitobacter aestuariivivens]|nr:hypothetical protein [Sulfitobacter aestuariivivens]